ncbi:MAG: Spy/CpxP family protein refolding chaperone [Terriglobales bacterium]
MKSNYFKVLAIALLVAVVAAIGVSQTVKRAHMRADGMFGGTMFGGPGFGGHMLGHLAHKLDLTDAQQAQVKEILAKEKPAFQPLMLQMAQNHQQMRQLVMANGFDEAKVRELASQQTQTMTELTVQRARVESELFQVLTPDQKTKLTTIIAQHEQRFMNHMQGQAQGQGPTQAQ